MTDKRAVGRVDWQFLDDFVEEPSSPESLPSDPSVRLAPSRASLVHDLTGVMESALI
jgi:hypothetical protein